MELGRGGGEVPAEQGHEMGRAGGESCVASWVLSLSLAPPQFLLTLGDCGLELAAFLLNGILGAKRTS